MKRNPNFRSHPALVWGLLLNAAALLLRDEWPVPPPLPLGDLLQGAALGLMLVGLLLSDPPESGPHPELEGQSLETVRRKPL